jgi:translation initiation factor 2 beta subunit (eIF-2beta)/eIF-5
MLDAKNVRYPSFYVKCCEANSTDKALHTLWRHIISGL